MLLAEGDAVIVDEYSYPGALESIRPIGAQLMGVRMDGHGMCPDHLAVTLNSATRSGSNPKILYTVSYESCACATALPPISFFPTPGVIAHQLWQVPTGHNPCGITMPTARRQEIYQICSKHDVLILEDDPYWYLSLDAQGDQQRKLDSFLKLDTEGRVLRFDSLSKAANLAEPI